MFSLIKNLCSKPDENDKPGSSAGQVSVKGYCAQPGKVKGTVKIVSDHSKPVETGPGEILVMALGSTYPIAAIGKPSAIVAAEGGITCHLAKKARECGIPCIVGAQSAAQIFKDGDEVEVDAENGNVTLVQNS